MKRSMQDKCINLIPTHKTKDVSVIHPSECISCSFTNFKNRSPAFPHGKVEVYYGLTENFISDITNLNEKLSNNEIERARKFLSDSDRNTYIACHGNLRIILSSKLGRSPSQIEILSDENNKPFLKQNPLHFNISHDRNAFAIAVSEYTPVGIDIEKIKHDLEYSSLLNSVFTSQEISSVRDNPVVAREIFFLLWTRKEALLKAMGTGIIDDLNKIDVSGMANEVRKVNLDNLKIKAPEAVSKDYFIYSLGVSDYYISIALPQQVEIRLVYLNEVASLQNLIPMM